MLLLLVLSAARIALSFTFPDCKNGPLSQNTVCDASASIQERANALISLFSVNDLLNNTVNGSPGVPRLNLSNYQWWSEALHGVAGSPGVAFAGSGNFSSATSFPQPILMSAAFDDDLIHQVGTVVSTEARAFSNVGRAGLDFWTPNINPFRDPRWGRGQETPGEDPFRISNYVFNLVTGLQGGVDPKPYLKVISTCKHYAAYDLERWEGIVRYGFNAVVSQQDLVEYYLPPFQTCLRDAKGASTMCSYNAVNGIPSCADSYLLQSVLRDYWGFEGWVVSDCDAIGNIFTDHAYTSTFPEAVAAALNAGCDLNCGSSYSAQLPIALNQSLITVDELKRSLIRLYSSLIRVGYFDDPSNQPYRSLAWSDVNTLAAQNLAKQAAVEGMVLLKNDGVLPLKPSVKKLAVIGPWGNATNQMQGNYAGTAPFLISPRQGALNAGFNVTFAAGTAINTTSTSGFAAAVAAASGSDAIIFAGGIDNSIEAEDRDRMNISWPGNQLALLSQLSQLGKPVIVVQFGGGQVDDSTLKNDDAINAILWAGYPGQSGGDALFSILKGTNSPAGRLPVTQYPANYVSQVPMTDMTLRPSANSPGRTYKFYTGNPVYEFGHGLHYTTFNVTWAQGAPRPTIDIASIVTPDATDTSPFATFPVTVKNTGKVTSDYVALLFVNGTFGPEPFPNKQLVSYSRVKGLKPGASSQVELPVSLGSIARADNSGNLWVYPGAYQVTVDTPGLLTAVVHLTGNAAQLTHWPQNNSSSV